MWTGFERSQEFTSKAPLLSKPCCKWSRQRRNPFSNAKRGGVTARVLIGIEEWEPPEAEIRYENEG